MTDLFPDARIDLAAQIKCIEREIEMRKRAYPRFVEARKMTQSRADYEIEAMRAVLESLQRLRGFAI